MELTKTLPVMRAEDEILLILLEERTNIDFKHIVFRTKSPES